MAASFRREPHVDQVVDDTPARRSPRRPGRGPDRPGRGRRATNACRSRPHGRSTPRPLAGLWRGRRRHGRTARRTNGSPRGPEPVVEQPVDAVDLRARLAVRDVLEHVDAGRQGADDEIAGQVEQVQRRAVADEHPARVVGAGNVRLLERGHRRGGVRGRGERERDLTARPLRRVAAVRERPVRQSGDDATVVDRQPRPTGKEVAAADRPVRVLPEKPGRRGRPVEALVTIGRDDERPCRQEPRGDDEQAHGPAYPAIRTSRSASASGASSIMSWPVARSWQSQPAATARSYDRSRLAIDGAVWRT